MYSAASKVNPNRNFPVLGPAAMIVLLKRKRKMSDEVFFMRAVVLLKQWSKS